MTVKVPSTFFYNIIGRCGALLYAKIFRMEVNRPNGFKFEPPFVILSNHASNIDFLPVMKVTYPIKLNFVLSDFFIRNKFLRYLAKECGCITKPQFYADFSAVRKIIRVIRRGGNIAIFPSGLSTYSGEATFIPVSTAKLVKKLAVPVIAIQISGAHLAYPKWNMKVLRKSKCILNITPLFTKEDLLKKDIEEIYKDIVQALYFDEYEWQKKNLIPSKKPRSCEGIERIFTICPNCMNEFSLNSLHNKILCSKCNFATNMNEYGLFEYDNNTIIRQFETPTEWYKWQRNHYKSIIDESFVYSEHAEIRLIHDNGRRTVLDKGIISISINKLSFESSSGRLNYSMDNGSSYSLVCEGWTEFEAWFSGQLYAIAPTNKNAVHKFVLLKEIIYQKYYNHYGSAG